MFLNFRASAKPLESPGPRRTLPDYAAPAEHVFILGEQNYHPKAAWTSLSVTISVMGSSGDGSKPRARKKPFASSEIA